LPMRSSALPRWQRRRCGAASDRYCFISGVIFPGSRKNSSTGAAFGPPQR
jgi:hypothetical protein